MVDDTVHYTCDMCGSPFHFCRNYTPDQYLEGRRDSKVWVIGLNPRQDPDWVDERTADQLQLAFDDGALVGRRSLKRDPFFRDYRSVSMRLFDFFGLPGGAAHTDLVKCSSRSFPPKGVDVDAVVTNCLPHLKSQLERHRPRVIVCNGMDVVRAVAMLLGQLDGAKETSYFSEIRGQEVGVVNSGFVGRIDRLARARLGRDVDTMLDRYGLFQG